MIVTVEKGADGGTVVVTVRAGVAGEVDKTAHDAQGARLLALAGEARELRERCGLLEDRNANLRVDIGRLEEQRDALMAEDERRDGIEDDFDKVLGELSVILGANEDETPTMAATRVVGELADALAQRPALTSTGSDLTSAERARLDQLEEWHAKVMAARRDYIVSRTTESFEAKVVHAEEPVKTELRDGQWTTSKAVVENSSTDILPDADERAPDDRTSADPGTRVPQWRGGKEKASTRSSKMDAWARNKLREVQAAWKDNCSDAGIVQRQAMAYRLNLTRKSYETLICRMKALGLVEVEPAGEGFQRLTFPGVAA